MDTNILKTMTLFVTGRCNHVCPMCSQRPLRNECGGHELSIEQLDRFISQTIRLGLHYDTLQITGGEPMVWGGIYEGIALLRGSEIADKIKVFTNAIDIARYNDKFIENIYRLDVSVYPGVNEVQANTLKRRYGEKVLAAIIDHLPFPKKEYPHAEVLPATCHCDGFELVGSWMYYCPNAYSNWSRMNKKYDLNHLRCPVSANWVAYFGAMDRYNHPMCASCAANKAVKMKLEAKYGVICKGVLR